MSAIRKYERSIVKHNIEKEGSSVKRTFSKRWDDFREKKYVTKDADGNVISDKTPKNTMRKKQNHFDNVEQYTRLFAWMDSVRAAREKKIENKEEVKA